tara:strand:+ start:553 stop:1083 length:531 start_codon:yes stop_codon:yes gene_type:complete
MILKTRKVRKKNKNKTIKKNSKIKKMVKIFQLYSPEIFPRGYFKFLQGNLQERINNKELIFKNGVILSWKVYKNVPSKYKKIGLKKGDIKINHLVNKNQGNGAAKKIFLKFLKNNKDKNLILIVYKNNKRAMRFYKKNGFKRVGKVNFKDTECFIMKKTPLKNKTNKTNKTKKGGS